MVQRLRLWAPKLCFDSSLIKHPKHKCLSQHRCRVDGSRDGMTCTECRWVWLTPVVVSKISTTQGLDPPSADSPWMQMCLPFFSAHSFLYDHMHRTHGKDFVAMESWSKSHMSLRFCFFFRGWGVGKNFMWSRNSICECTPKRMSSRLFVYPCL